MLIVKEAPLLKLTPFECSTALSVKRKAPDGSLGSGNEYRQVRDWKGTHIILLKLAKGVPFSPAGGGLRGGGRAEGRPRAKPAAFAPEPIASMSLSLRPGRPSRRVATPWPPMPGVEAVATGKGGLSARFIRLKPFTVASTEFMALSRERLTSWRERKKG